MRLHKDTAIYLPALSGQYVRFISDDIRAFRANPPAGLTTDQLNILNENAYLHHPYALYSAGGAEFDLDRSLIVEEAIHVRDRSKTFLLADSGGFQQIKNTLSLKLNFDNKPQVERNLQTILNWVESYADLGMTFDIPLYAINELKQPRYETFDDCLTDTVISLDHWFANKKPETQLLNCLHGSNADEAKVWWEQVKKYQSAGYAFGGAIKENLYTLLDQIARIIDQGYMENTYHLHFLGIASGVRAAFLNHLQIRLRETFPQVQITYDTASGSRTSGEAKQFALGVEVLDTPSFLRVRYEQLGKVFSLTRTEQKEFYERSFKELEEIGFPLTLFPEDKFNLMEILRPMKTKDRYDWDELSLVLVSLNNNYWEIVKTRLASTISQTIMDKQRQTDQRIMLTYGGYIRNLLELVDKVFDAKDMAGAIEANRTELEAAF